MEYLLAILPAIVIIFLILVLAYLTQTSLKNKFIKPMDDRIQALEEANKQKDKTIKELSDTLLALQVEMEHMADDVMSFLKQQPIEPVKEEKPEPKADFYMSTPNKDGSFSMASYSEVFMPSVSIYKFMPIGDEQAEFRIESDEQGMRDALNFSASYIQPVCEEENDLTPETKRIVTVRNGLANLNKGQWTVLRKALVRYE
jgi:uncharacterized coiled-coil protein SlyX